MKKEANQKEDVCTKKLKQLLTMATDSFCGMMKEGLAMLGNMEVVAILVIGERISKDRSTTVER